MGDQPSRAVRVRRDFHSRRAADRPD